ncbi:16S rRNA (adenine(1518)-N(6)/adenine(1519)-N(6))-dimethyltransferase [Pseudoclavibacter sp. RFBJ3]|uniref:16S rRNA (adenine(1518)-N(6)/adenine(1519)-N(6))- dimethyltransferase RsmA n=1 Tax=unclassified Pseudoclavibacter TaxID=2615177 RepID=UPI000CE814C9|nr:MULTISPECIES: 16S rRNA (adenine(1518)-N(6)/adenine(1519)-N(6))-dimethyltransferase RsmA [unclassified Pseudoclavibacter]PPF83723.1 16S rRNA (adenine(1518)-N(6)/adenine(1519)-N(6))-dimethyltransferase [Pseudoclavibacter sp. RFBJ5]PPF92003.1 16S rRNA (adenine(1518)-N(6)/adenine(1519)-N(6))-dimethyltransferase [Pseudoclavibacter sp. RFBJ3]PPF96866.1 16S rRNA (adenine(1518)-N(6)/adenine(1519)-N(6))-dimethyltransferase [Pseudoclavibacter sp. RFBH5]PPG23552.1 16S rRNA (adenine(1518)-N(6)/adenine(1
MSVSLLGANEIRELAAELDVTPTKKLGQNFVHDPGTVRRIVQTAKVRSGEHILEVGPGLGSLTLGLLETGASVTAIEIDERLAARLPQTVEEHAPGARLDVIVSDALQVQEVPGEPVALVANLPYNVSVPVLLHLLERLPSLQRGVVMVQAEVGERIVAGPGSKVYGSPSVKAAWYGTWSSAGLVGRKVFWPVPNVDSILISYTERAEPRGSEELRRKVFRIVDAAFGQRRKMLRQALSPLLGENAAATSLVLEASGIDPTARGETVGIDDYVRLAEAWTPEV